MTALQRPLDLPRLVMRRAAWVALGAWLLMLVLGLQRAAVDMELEVQAARTMAELVSRLAQPSMASDGELIAQLQRVVRVDGPRHLALSVRDAAGTVLFATAEGEPLRAPLSWLVQLHRSLVPVHEPAPVSWRLPRHAGPPWSVTVAVSHDSERAEAVANLAALLALGALGSVALLLAMGWNVHRAFRPMRALLQAIAALRDDARALRALPPMPINELQAIAGALRELAEALEAAEQQRRALSRQVLTLQEDERQRIARELHDEFGQRLTALRADAAWLSRRLSDARAQGVVGAMAAHFDALQSEIRSLLTRLSPAGGDGAGDLLRLQHLLQELVQAWNASPGQAARYALALQARAADGRALPWPSPELASACALPHELCLALYRISQEALTNVARHANASQATLQLTLCEGDESDSLQWQVSDDGAGLGSLRVALQRGNGLAGIRQRVWALGSDLECEAACAGATDRLGVCLRARFRMPAARPLRAADGFAI
jgi:two-component system, NarL family, sensor histidine kinase UhpB